MGNTVRCGWRWCLPGADDMGAVGIQQRDGAMEGQSVHLSVRLLHMDKFLLAARASARAADDGHTCCPTRRFWRPFIAGEHPFGRSGGLPAERYGQVFLIDLWVTGICFLAGLFLCGAAGGTLGCDRFGAGAADGHRAESVARH